MAVKVVPKEEMLDHIGTKFEPGQWIEIDQDRINTFADCTEDHQFIHVDEEAAKATPFGGTIAHGFLTLSLLPFLMGEKALKVDGTVMGSNNGSDKVRFIQPVRVGSRVRARQVLLDAVEKKPGQWLIKTAVTVEIEREEKPALVAEFLSMLIVK